MSEILFQSVQKPPTFPWLENAFPLFKVFQSEGTLTFLKFCTTEEKNVNTAKRQTVQNRIALLVSFKHDTTTFQTKTRAENYVEHFRVFETNTTGQGQCQVKCQGHGYMSFESSSNILKRRSGICSIDTIPGVLLQIIYGHVHVMYHGPWSSIQYIDNSRSLYVITTRTTQSGDM